MEKTFGKTIRIPTTDEVSFDLGEITPKNASGSKYACRLDTCDDLIPVSVTFKDGKAVCSIPTKYDVVNGFDEKGNIVTESKKVPEGNLHISICVTY